MIDSREAYYWVNEHAPGLQPAVPPPPPPPHFISLDEPPRETAGIIVATRSIPNRKCA